MTDKQYETKYWNVEHEQIDEHNEHIKEAAAAIQHQEAVAFPTETVYGLGADATTTEAVHKIFQAKGRPGDNPLIVHIANLQQVETVAEEIPDQARKLMDAFWPGSLTVILKSNGASAENVTAGLSTVGVRMPDHPVARALLTACKLPVAAPSANQSGRPSPTTAQHVLDDLTGKVYGVVDGGPTGVGVESTVVDCTAETAVILRPGGVTKEDLEAVIGPVKTASDFKNERKQPKAPGMKYTHYAPNAPFWLMEGNVNTIQNEINRLHKEGKRVGVMASEEHAEQYQHAVVKSCGSKEDLKEVAHKIYHCLRSFNNEDVDIILGETFPKEGVGAAVMNRLEKAATKVMK
ncbi:L-threonylcarbamoyladenylate synthase [Salinibacillus kushneri]|uniref:Threonylcarbamoyl-AMP synthase n=1 Tax=Salinibacillus kushneri TaxID=237682 RepID=A0A1I0CWJ3_9BACI|nr:L-threonylcarbamoyladenylate synthase [Salinibacillus kushneri]SET23805.1 L-threonylcarbamoyladenylate synthase [Salinibacillus kushneri]